MKEYRIDFMRDLRKLIKEEEFAKQVRILYENGVLTMSDSLDLLKRAWEKAYIRRLKEEE